MAAHWNDHTHHGRAMIWAPDADATETGVGVGDGCWLGTGAHRRGHTDPGRAMTRVPDADATGAGVGVGDGCWLGQVLAGDGCSLERSHGSQLGNDPGTRRRRDRGRGWDWGWVLSGVVTRIPAGQ